jgi:ABC-type antimicrobial peptide transport system permease subunit
VGQYDVEIVGVVRDARYMALSENQEMAAYYPYTQRVQYFGNLSVRSSAGPDSLVPAVRRALAQVNPNILVATVTPLADMVQGSIATQRMIGILSGMFAGLAVLLAGIGVYGLISYSVARRTGEIGIRLALGAEKHTVVWLVLRESIVLLFAGLAVGLPLAVVLATSLRRVLSTALFHVQALDPWTFAGAIAVVSVMTLAAACIPGRRATRVEPSVALRCE